MPGAEEILADGGGPYSHHRYNLMQDDAIPRKSFTNQLINNGRMSSPYLGGSEKMFPLHKISIFLNIQHTQIHFMSFLCSELMIFCIL